MSVIPSEGFFPRRRRRALACLMACVMLLGQWLAVAQAWAQLPDMGDGSDITTAAERRLGDQIAREIYRHPSYLDDPVLGEYVLDIWQRLMAAARTRGELTAELDERFAWNVMLIRDRSVNAFALPGGYIGVHLGLIAVVDSADELASVLGHELSHVTQRHISRMYGEQSRQLPVLLAAMILGAIAASQSADAGSAIMAGGQTVAMRQQLGFSRSMEREADRVGYTVLKEAGFAPQGMAAMFEKLQQASHLNDNGSFPYLRTHPMTGERIAEARTRLQADGGDLTSTVALTAVHAMMAARARVLVQPGAATLREWMKAPQASTFAAQTPAQRAGMLYAAALSAVQINEAAQARDFAARLQEEVTADARAARLARLLVAEIELSAGDGAVALQKLGTPDAALMPRPELMLFSRAWLRSGQPQQAVRPLQRWLLDHPGDAMAWQLLAQSWQAQGQPLRQIRAEGEARIAVRDYEAARDSFRSAQDMARRASGVDYMDVSVIDARLREVEAIIREQADGAKKP